MKTVLKFILAILGVLAGGFAVFVGYATVADYKPAPVMRLYKNKTAAAVPADRELNLMIWNIGYAGLSKDMDFFYDGGTRVRPLKKVVQENLTAIESFLSRQTQVDFILLQEVDQKSKRSYAINEVSSISERFPGFHSSFGKNYDVFFVPLPVTDPLGSVKSGLQTLGRFEPFSVKRYSFPGNYKWPKGLFMLDRCFLVSRYRLKNNPKTLLVINTHNSAYDDGTLRAGQMRYLKKFLAKEYDLGNFVIIGGDWNQCPPLFVPKFEKNKMDNQNRMDIEPDFLTGWQWAYDDTVPTNRRLSAPYDETASLTTVIDFFLVSPNIEIRKVRTVHLDFEHTDHQPVFLQIRLKSKQSVRKRQWEKTCFRIMRNENLTANNCYIM